MSIDETAFSSEKQIAPINNKLNMIQKIFDNSIFGKFNNKSNEAIETKPLPTSLADNVDYFDGNILKDDQTNEKTLESNNLQSGAVYMPEISRIQYLNRQDKLKDIRQFVIKDSTSDFILI